MIVVLKDKQTLQDTQDFDGAEYEVDEVYTLENVDNVLNFDFWKLKKTNLAVLSKQVGDLEDWFVFYNPELQFGSKEDWIKNGQEWLFDGDNYVEEIYKEGHTYKILGGVYPVINTQNGLQGFVTEWVCPDEVDNPRLICIEIGNYIEFYQGVHVLPTEVEFLGEV